MKAACNVVNGSACVAGVKFQWAQFREELRKLALAFTSRPPAPINPVAPTLTAEEALGRMPCLRFLGDTPKAVCSTLWALFQSMPSTFKQMDPMQPSDADLLGALAIDVHPWFSRCGVSVPLPWEHFYSMPAPTTPPGASPAEQAQAGAAAAIALTFFSFVCSRAFCMDSTLLITNGVQQRPLPAPHFALPATTVSPQPSASHRSKLPSFAAAETVEPPAFPYHQKGLPQAGFSVPSTITPSARGSRRKPAAAAAAAPSGRTRTFPSGTAPAPSFSRGPQPVSPVPQGMVAAAVPASFHGAPSPAELPEQDSSAGMAAAALAIPGTGTASPACQFAEDDLGFPLLHGTPCSPSRTSTVSGLPHSPSASPSFVDVGTPSPCVSAMVGAPPVVAAPPVTSPYSMFSAPSPSTVSAFQLQQSPQPFQPVLPRSQSPFANDSSPFLDTHTSATSPASYFYGKYQ